MKLTTVLSAVNNNPSYYMFIPKQILFWGKFNINFFAVFIGESIPKELQKYSENIILWKKNLNINTAFVGQNMRIYYPALLNLPDDEMVMITDMDMLPMNCDYYKNEIDKYNIDDFIYYRYIDRNQIYMCYNAAHPKTWSKIFGINNESDIETNLYNNYNGNYSGIPGETGWFIDQEILYKKLINYPYLKVLNRPIKRLEMDMYVNHLKNGNKNFISHYDDAHFHRNYSNNLQLILDAEKQLLNNHIYFITFGSQTFSNSIKRIYNQARNFKFFDNVLILNEIDLKNKCPLFWNRHKEFVLNNKRLYGYAIWKPFIILKTLESIEENSILVYTDSGCTLNINGLNRMNEYFDIVRNSKHGILSFQLPFFEKQYTKMDLFEHMNLNNNEFLNSKQLLDGIIFFRKCEKTIKLVKEWYEICCNYHLIDDSPSILPNDEIFIEHRHDQSVFSLLAKKYGTEILPDETYFNNFSSEGINYPIWATRLK